MVEIVVSASRPIAQGAIVTGYAIAGEQPQSRSMQSCEPTSLTRVYVGFGKLRAETGIAPRRGFGTLIEAAEIAIPYRDGMDLWLRVRD